MTVHRKSKGIALLFLQPRRWMRSVVNTTPRPIYPRELSGTHFIGGWMGPRDGQDGYEKSRPPPRFYPRTVEPVAGRYTDGAMAAHVC